MRNLLHRHTPFMIGLLVVLLGSLLAFRATIDTELFRTHDSVYHGARLVNYYLAIKQEQLPPRWAPNLNLGFGYPVFSFIYPLPYLVGTIFFVVTNSVGLSINLYSLLAVFVLVSGWYLLSWLHFKNVLTSLVTSVLMVSAPYFLLTIFVRGAVAETMFIGLLPWMLMIIRESNRLFKQWWGRLLALVLVVVVILAHQISLIIGAPIFLGYVMWRWGKQREILVIWLAIGVVATLLTAWFWLPLFAEISQIVIANNETFTVSQIPFTPWQNVVWESWAYGGFTPGVIDEGFSRMIGPSFLLLAGISILLHVRAKKANKEYLFWAVILLFSIYLMTPSSSVIWSVFKPLRLLQFPYRLLWVATLAAGMLWLLVQPLITKRFRQALLLVVASMSLLRLFFWAHPVATFSQETYSWLEYPLTGDAYQEMLPKKFTPAENALVLDNIAFLSDAALQAPELVNFENSEQFLQTTLIPSADLSIINLNWVGSHMNYEIDVPEKGMLLHKTAFFPGWKVWVDGQEIEIVHDHPFFSGRILIPVAPGKHSIKAQFTDFTAPRQIGLILSALGFGTGMLFVYAWPSIARVSSSAK